ncbi:uncharacterized protein AB9W97_015772 isoform 2-T2 [Spinachia spinachia]
MEKAGARSMNVGLFLGRLPMGLSWVFLPALSIGFIRCLRYSSCCCVLLWKYRPWSCFVRTILSKSLWLLFCPWR